LQRIFESCALAQTPEPLIRYAANDLWMEFPFSKGYLSLLDEYNAGKKLDDGSPKGSPKTEERIVALMFNHPQISTEAIADILKISKRAVVLLRDGTSISEEGYPTPRK